MEHILLVFSFQIWHPHVKEIALAQRSTKLGIEQNKSASHPLMTWVNYIKVRIYFKIPQYILYPPCISNTRINNIEYIADEL